MENVGGEPIQNEILVGCMYKEQNIVDNRRPAKEFWYLPKPLAEETTHLPKQVAEKKDDLPSWSSACHCRHIICVAEKVLGIALMENISTLGLDVNLISPLPRK